MISVISLTVAYSDRMKLHSVVICDCSPCGGWIAGVVPVDLRKIHPQIGVARQQHHNVEQVLPVPSVVYMFVVHGVSEPVESGGLHEGLDDGSEACLS